MSKKRIGIVTISGFTETSRAATGMDALQRLIEDTYQCVHHVEVYDLRPWKFDAEGLAALLKRDGMDEAIVIGYSWGGGYGSPRLCKALVARGISIPLVLLCDPVYRPQWLPAWGPANIFGFRALIPNSATIKFPSVVRRVVGVRQKNNIPRGHKVQIGKYKPKSMTLLRRKNINHQTIDSSRSWFGLVSEELERICK